MQQYVVFGCRLRRYYHICRFVSDVSTEQPLELPPDTHHIRQEVVADGPREDTNPTIYTMVIIAGPHDNQLPCFDHAMMLFSRARWDFRQNLVFRSPDRMTTVAKVDLGFTPFLFAGPLAIL